MVEIDSELADDFDRSAIFEQVQMGVAVRMACLKALIDNSKKNKMKNPFNNNKKTTNNYLLKDGFLIDPNSKKIVKKDLFIKDKIISEIGDNLSKSVEKELKS